MDLYSCFYQCLSVFIRGFKILRVSAVHFVWRMKKRARVSPKLGPSKPDCVCQRHMTHSLTISIGRAEG